MERNRQDQIAFYLTGSRTGTTLLPMSSGSRPALLSRFSDLASLRYDLPVVLNRDRRPERALLSLSKMVDDAVEGLAEGTDRTRVARHGYAIEQEIRKELASSRSGDLESLWEAAVERLAESGVTAIGDSAALLWNEFQANGELCDAGADLPAKVVEHAWKVVQSSKARAFRSKADRLLQKLHDILDAEVVSSNSGRAPERLRAGMGAGFAATFDFDILSGVLIGSKPGIELSEKRRKRIHQLIDVLERQRFYPLGDGGPEPYEFEFVRCSDALKAYNLRHSEAIELTKTLTVAELEAAGEYRESIHDVLFDGFRASGLNAAELSSLPDYLIVTDAGSLDAAEMADMVQILSAGVAFKVLVRTDDVLEPATAVAGRITPGYRARQLVNTTMGLTDVFVFQASSSQIFLMRDALMDGLNFNGAAFFSIFSGKSPHSSSYPAYIVAAAANESRVFPSLVFDPSAGPDWASRLDIGTNPRVDKDWVSSDLTYEDDDLQAHSEEIAFTLADLMAMDERYREHFAIVAKSDWNDAMIPVAEAALNAAGANSIPDTVPYIELIDEDGRMQRAIVDDRLMAEVRRCLSMWHSLQELGGQHNSHAERLLESELKSRAAEAPPTSIVSAAPTGSEPQSLIEIATALSSEPEPAAAIASDEPYIESARCTSCNECTGVNPKMFAYDDNKQAYIADPDAGTFRQLVEAAEGCQVSIIHPGKPRNPREPGLEDLLRRAAEFG